jgi:hypothetical protein
MEQVVPIIFTPPVERPVVPAAGRLLALLIAGTAVSLLVIGTMLPPSPAGIGTHRRMGFQACEFERITRLPCPTCGMTTSFSWFVRGNWLASLYVQPMGFALALAAGATFWGGMYIAITGRPIHRLLRQIPGVWLVCGAMGFGIAAWGWKIFIHLNGMDGWR